MKKQKTKEILIAEIPKRIVEIEPTSRPIRPFPRVVVGVDMPFNCEISMRLQLNLMLIEPTYCKLLIFREDNEGNNNWRIAKAYEEMRKFFITNIEEATHLLFLAYDIDVPAETITTMLSQNADIVYHAYDDIKEGMGCILIKRKVLEQYSFTEGIERERKEDSVKLFWKWVKFKKFKIVKLNNILKIIHFNYSESL